MDYYHVVQHYTKIKNLLDRFLKAECPKKVETHLEKWLNHLWQQADADIQFSLLTLPIFTDWLVRAVTTWEKQNVTPPAAIASFALNLAGLLSKNEKKLNTLNSNNVFIKLTNIANVKNSGNKLAYIKLLSTFLEHNEGVAWITTSTFWVDILELSLLDCDPRIVAESTDFLSKMLDRSIDYEANFCNRAIKRIMAPMGENIYKTLIALHFVDGTSVQSCKPSLKLIGNILEYFLDGILFDQKDYRVVLLFFKNFHWEEQFADFMITEHDRSFDHDLARVMFIMQFLQMYININLRNVSTEDISGSVQKLKKNYYAHLSKGPFIDIMGFLNFGCLYWKLFDSKIYPVVKDHLMTFADHCACWLLAPNLFFLAKHFVALPELEHRLENDDGRNYNVFRFLKRLESDYFRVIYDFRRFFVTASDTNHYAVKSIIYMKKSRKYITKDAIVASFQRLLYELQDIITAVIECPQKLDDFLDEEYFSELFEFLAVYLGEFHITWKDIFETANVMAVTFDFLMLTRWSTRVVVEALNLIKVAIRESVAPNMALLMDTTENSTLDLLGTLLAAKLLDVSEIKVAALEVIYTLGRMTKSKFPSLQKVLMDSELPTLVVKMSTCDSESFVRATAIKCLQEMIQVEEIWNNALKTEDLPQKMRDVLLNETEGIVRVEAATFMCVAYENQQLPKETLDRVYETMIYSSTTDLHWEVKVRALDFWDKVIKNHLQNQGMIDGSFPNVTFSKEHRKIVTLTDSEIRKRLLKVLSQLSSIGCLGVLMSAIKDDCDMEVSKTAAKISQGLVDLFKKYNVRSDGSTPTSPLPTENGMSTASVSSGVSVDESMDSPATNHHDLNEEIIDQIVNSKDICLLKNVYTPSDYGSVSNYDIQVRRIVTPNEFLQFTQQDLNSIINEKKNWLNGIEDLGSLLDDMLKTYDDDVNNMDCY